MGNLQLTYTKDFGEHHIDALALMEGQQYKTFWNSEQSFKFDTNYFGFNNMKAGANVSWAMWTPSLRNIPSALTWHV